MTDPRRIVITGLSRGLGLAMTEEFIRCGHMVLGCARSSSDIAALRKRFPTPHDFTVVDVGQDATAYLGPDRWAKKAVPFVLKLRPRDNGKPLTVPS